MDLRFPVFNAFKIRPVCSWDSALQLRLSVGNKSIHLFLEKHQEWLHPGKLT